MADQPVDSHRPAQLDIDEIPVEELIRITRAFTRRITNQDRQRLALALRESGHHRSIRTTAPIELQRFFSGESDLDAELAQRFPNAPLLSHLRLIPRPGEPAQRQATAIISSQDDSASMMIDVPVSIPDPQSATIDVSFSLMSMLAVRFTVAPLVEQDRARWLDLMRRENGITFLWTHYRWEHPYVIFVVREHFARLYAFSPAGIEAAARLTPDVLDDLIGWLEGLWFAEGSAHESVAEWAHTPTLMPRPAGMTDHGTGDPQAEAGDGSSWPEGGDPGMDEGGESDSLDESDLEW